MVDSNDSQVLSDADRAFEEAALIYEGTDKVFTEMMDEDPVDFAKAVLQTRLEVSDPDYPFLRVICWEALGRNDLTEEDEIFFLMHLADVHRYLDNYEECIKVCTKALEIRDDLAILSIRMSANRRLGNLVEAREDCWLAMACAETREQRRYLKKYLRTKLGE